ncbi:MAG: hypothetical protein V4710_18385 [Verrucomicrobiota bacterium]
MKLVRKKQRLRLDPELAILSANANDGCNAGCLELAEGLSLVFNPTVEPLQVITDGGVSIKGRAEHKVVAIGMEKGREPAADCVGTDLIWLTNPYFNGRPGRWIIGNV